MLDFIAKISPAIFTCCGKIFKEGGNIFNIEQNNLLTSFLEENLICL